MNPTNDWPPCETGELQDLRHALVRDDRRQLVGRAAKIGGVAVLLLAVVVLGSSTDPTASNPAMISCDTFMTRMPAYHAYLVEDAAMPAAHPAEMKAHLAKCDKCRGQFNEQYPGVLPATIAAALPLLWLLCRPRSVCG